MRSQLQLKTLGQFSRPVFPGLIARGVSPGAARARTPSFLSPFLLLHVSRIPLAVLLLYPVKLTVPGASAPSFIARNVPVSRSFRLSFPSLRKCKRTRARSPARAHANGDRDEGSGRSRIRRMLENNPRDNSKHSTFPVESWRGSSWLEFARNSRIFAATPR